MNGPRSSYIGKGSERVRVTLSKKRDGIDLTGLYLVKIKTTLMMDRKSDRQTNRQTDRQTDRQTENGNILCILS